MGPHSQAFVVDHFDNRPDTLLRQFWHGNASQGPVAQKERTVITFCQLGSLPDCKWSDSNSDGNRGSAINSCHGRRRPRRAVDFQIVDVHGYRMKRDVNSKSRRIVWSEEDNARPFCKGQ